MTAVTAGATRTHGAGDEIVELYAALAVRLPRIVGRQVRAPDPVIEDACQFAWSTLLRDRGRVRPETTLAWLVTTAAHEALKLIRQQRRELSLDELDRDGYQPATEAIGASVEEQVERRLRLQAICDLPERQQRLVWLQGLGLSYSEMAGYTGSTPRTVERQLLRGKRTLRTTAVG